MEKHRRHGQQADSRFDLIMQQMPHLARRRPAKNSLAFSPIRAWIRPSGISGITPADIAVLLVYLRG